MSNITKKDVVEMLRANFEEVERHTRHLLNMKVRHHPTDGSNREDIYADVLREFISDKYEIAQNVFIIDSDGNISKEVDIAIYEKTYIPYIFKKGSLKVLPIEGVFAVVQAKSDVTNTNTDNLSEWEKSVSSLESKCGEYSGSITKKIDGKFPVEGGRKYKPLAILMAFDNRNSNKQITDEQFQNIFDYTILFTNENVRVIENKKSINEKLNGVWDERNEEKRNAWFYTQNPDEKKDLLYFYFQLNKYLLAINNPHPFPLAEYSKLICEVEKKNEKIE